jgi:hypothetical protein
VQAGPTFKLLATNDLGDANHASAAAAGDALYILGRKRLYAIGRNGN